jgi:hypothetical protein
MAEQFLLWWFDTHYIWSTILTPFWTMLWTIFKGEFLWRGVVCCIIWIGSGIGIVGTK